MVLGTGNLGIDSELTPVHTDSMTSQHYSWLTSTMPMNSSDAFVVSSVLTDPVVKLNTFLDMETLKVSIYDCVGQNFTFGGLTTANKDDTVTLVLRVWYGNGYGTR